MLLVLERVLESDTRWYNLTNKLKITFKKEEKYLKILKLNNLNKMNNVIKM